MSAAIFLIFFRSPGVVVLPGEEPPAGDDYKRRRRKRRDWIRRDPWDHGEDDDDIRLPQVGRELAGYAPAPIPPSLVESPWGLSGGSLPSRPSARDVMDRMLAGVTRWQPQAPTRARQPWDTLPDDPAAEEAVKRMLRSR